MQKQTSDIVAYLVHLVQQDSNNVHQTGDYLQHAVNLFSHHVYSCSMLHNELMSVQLLHCASIITIITNPVKDIAL